jgi:L-alanine-DL-glutamate epimerase-like enolase superfamily enzyme
MKVGAIGFSEEVEMLSRIRSEYGPGDLEIRLDANGAWSADEAPGKLEALSALGIHSVEQPVAAGQPEAMAELCMEPAVPVALDEELIGVTYPGKRQELLRMIRPQYIVLKPGLLGGLREAEQWIRAAGEMGIGWWITSALESNIGLNAIAQWTGQLEVTLPQGLGTGQLYRNNIPSPLKMEGDALWYRNEKRWDLSPVKL